MAIDRQGRRPRYGHGVIFLDKDGTLVRDVPYNVDTRRVVFEEGALNGLRRLAEAGFRFVIVSNQSGIAHGYFQENDLMNLARFLEKTLAQETGARIERFYFCPHHPAGSVEQYAVPCPCRKPQPGMLLTAAEDLNISLRESWMLGDILNDVEAGNRAGCRTILIDNGHETEWVEGPYRKADFTAADLEEAAEIIIAAKNAARKKPAALSIPILPVDQLSYRKTHGGQR